MDIQSLTGFSPGRLQGFRAKYSYPKAYIRIAEAGEAGDVQLPTGEMAVFCRPAAEEVTDLWLDQYHQDLLRSRQPSQVVLGLASAVYWGFYTFGKTSDGYALNRVHWLINGNPQNKGMKLDADHAMCCMENALSGINEGRLSHAMAALSGLNQLSRTPFASKIIAFMAPNKAGVYDKWICNGVNQDPYPLAIRNGVGMVSAPVMQRRYQAWCGYLQEIANLLNKNEAWRWSCGTDKEQRWRPLDVERALFAAFQHA